MNAVTLVWTTVPSPIGPLMLAASERGLVNVVFHAGEAEEREALARLRRSLGAEPVEDAEALRGVTDQLHAYFEGELKAFSLELDLRLATGFNRRVLNALAERVAFGRVASYQDLANWVGEPGAARAVGVAMATNPLPVVVPCHRVVESDGGLGGFGGGLETKRELLALEGVLPPALF
ncbi:methylated-DNA--[protein]-cysteine S-methyltransferase [Wenjunlia tyrosinilytica]|uniref:Methylated-DNA--protein-cysteine methyltransferase n=1 Tax=Wenjunlia tyrosinilytica TaxID=1544741 RepID=A0A918E0W5_9ACTN|nr:methylated-DNA--[protein]-cysteine S-methyltransferase [Wenjunlia tyrosinilytica]GGO95865.1 methylated-DNA--protein-cysteine methyltransferase [Wenjunlia tyrosinilytica]